MTDTPASAAASPDPSTENRRLEPGEVLHWVPHSELVGMRFVSNEGGVATLRVDWDEKLVGNPETGVLHGGVVTALLDNACGMAVHARLDSVQPIATLDLRIDYMRPATPREPVFARAECYKRTHHIAFVRGLAYQGDEDDPVAAAAATFMLHTPATRQPRSGE